MLGGRELALRVHQSVIFDETQRDLCSLGIAR